ncbi:MAG: holo-ACP synthase [Gallionellales bacterium 35-53-114]|jgi:holo-[acyl-carrier protein] synthase|nr:MAG: holo-ACP synthase [Gallionellales bacterium 35-53-114]OYZ63168.1 MAG: holo-ACP synthase [Gallionellales bacterium 24-53-125]OZB08634.1 MAG: holo-ACP synthase [Gallionellales bacterium 39-52-133]HQS57512.1 holo-ACP synthase [Gallionellaceae bacterium]HQS74300.1 holo-ACP synthase [Gallionellaceae bacterium]
MILGIGTDIAALARIESLHLRYGERFARRILSEIEMAEFFRHAHPARLLMKRFAAKEALAKAIGTGLRHPVSMTQMTVVHDELGKPGFEFSLQLSDYIEYFGVVRHHLSISDERDMAVAFVILEGAN